MYCIPIDSTEEEKRRFRRANGVSSPSPSGSIAAQDEFTFNKILGERLSREIERSASDEPVYQEVNELVKVGFTFVIF